MYINFKETRATQLKVIQKIFIAAVILCPVKANGSQKMPVSLSISGSLGFQHSGGSLKGYTYTQVFGQYIAEGNYRSSLSKNQVNGDVFAELAMTVSTNWNMALRPYFHQDNFKVSASKNSVIFQGLGVQVNEQAQLALKRQNAYGILISPQLKFQSCKIYGLLGAEFSRFSTSINLSRSIEGQPQDVYNPNNSKKIFSSAFVIRAGLSKELNHL